MGGPSRTLFESENLFDNMFYLSISTPYHRGRPKVLWTRFDIFYFFVTNITEVLIDSKKGQPNRNAIICRLYIYIVQVYTVKVNTYPVHH